MSTTVTTPPGGTAAAPPGGIAATRGGAVAAAPVPSGAGLAWFGCLTQYGIGSGPVMYGAGYVSQAQWWKTGFLMSVIYLAIWLTVGPLWWMMLGHV